MSRFSIAFLLSFVTFLLVGCGGGSSYEGEWTIDKEVMKAQMIEAMEAQSAGMPEAAVKAQIEMAESMVDKSSSTLSIKSDDTYILSSTMNGQTQTQSGTWKADGDSIVLSTKDQPDVKGEIKDGKLLIENPSSEGPRHTTLIRAKK